MKGKWVVGLTRNGNALTVAVPSRLVLDLGLRQHDPVHVQRVGNSLLVTPIADTIQARVNDDASAASAVLATSATL